MLAKPPPNNPPPTPPTDLTKRVLQRGRHGAHTLAVSGYTPSPAVLATPAACLAGRPLLGFQIESTDSTIIVTSSIVTDRCETRRGGTVVRCLRARGAVRTHTGSGARGAVRTHTGSGARGAVRSQASPRPLCRRLGMKLKIVERQGASPHKDTVSAVGFTSTNSLYSCRSVSGISAGGGHRRAHTRSAL